MRRGFLLLPLALVVACQTTPVSTANVDLYEFDIESSARVLQAGQVEIDVSNTGQFGHTLVITDSSGNVVSASEVIPPSGSTTLDLDLPPGDYQFTCRIVGQDGEGNLVDHFERGMSADITVEAP